MFLTVVPTLSMWTALFGPRLCFSLHLRENLVPFYVMVSRATVRRIRSISKFFSFSSCIVLTAVRCIRSVDTSSAVAFPLKRMRFVGFQFIAA